VRFFLHNLTQPDPLSLSLSLPRIDLCSPYIATDDIARTAEKLGYYLPWNLGGAAVAAIGYGLMSMLKPTTPSSKWIGYQIIYGIGSGSMVSVPYMAVQNLVPAPQIPIAMTIALFCQSIGAAIWLVAANAVFNNGLRQQLQQRYSEIGVDPDFIVKVGANSIRQIVQGDRLAAALECYTEAISHVMYLGVGLSVATFVFGTGLGWKDIRAAKKLQAIKSSPSSSSSSSAVTEDGKHSDAPKQATV
jgi:hypothetical protein